MSAEGDIQGEKDRIRVLVRERMASLPPDRWPGAAAALADRIRRMPEWSGARWVGGYVATRGEPDLGSLLDGALARGTRVAFPAYDAGTGAYGFREVRNRDRDFVAGRFGILEPRAECPAVPITWLDFVLVPGIAFDPQGGRLGRGKGFYDRLLAPFGGVSCGVCLDEQLVSGVPMEPHDVRLKLVATPLGLHGQGVLE